MIQTGLEIFSRGIPGQLKGRRIGVLCHAPSITKNFVHILDILAKTGDCKLTAIFGPQHGMYGQTQDNMIEWEGNMHPLYKVPVYSLYGKTRKPTPEMLSKIDILLVDLQDIGTRVYTYIWTVKLCIEACTETGKQIWILDRPNLIGKLPFDGPVLKSDFFSFVGGASIPLCHRMTVGELALWLKNTYYPSCEMNIIWMKGWNRHSIYSETELPWVIPSPNIPTLQSAIVYPGNVLFEGLNISEGRGTTIPFELFGAPFINAGLLEKNLIGRKIPGCKFRIHSFIPTFNKFCGEICHGLQVYVIDPENYYPVATSFEIIDAIIETSKEGALNFNPPPYEYEYSLIPFDILSGDTGMRKTLQDRLPLKDEIDSWKNETEEFRKEFSRFSVYDE